VKAADPGLTTEVALPCSASAYLMVESEVYAIGGLAVLLQFGIFTGSLKLEMTPKAIMRFVLISWHLYPH
jgi:hypothetical protein